MNLEEILLEGAAQPDGSGDGMFWGVIEGSPPKLRKRGETVALDYSASAEPAWKLWPGQKVLCYQQGSQRIIVKAMDGIGPWNNLNLLHDWEHYGGGFGNGQYRRIPGGWQLRGLVRNGTNAQIAQLPEGPGRTIVYNVRIGGYGGVARLNVLSAGTLTVTLEGTTWVSLAEIIVPLEGE